VTTMPRRPPLDLAQRQRLDDTCLRVANVLGDDPDDVMHDGTYVCLTVAQVDRLLVRAAAN
jgi:hypothetical protein